MQAPTGQGGDHIITFLPRHLVQSENALTFMEKQGVHLMAPVPSEQHPVVTMHQGSCSAVITVVAVTTTVISSFQSDHTGMS